MPEPDDRGRVVVALAPAPSAREQWSAKIVLDLLDTWSDSGHRVVLADCVLEHPMLHRSVGLPNDEGLVDAALFGASVSRVARPVPGRGFFFVGAGSPAGDAESVITSPRLGRLQQGFRDAGVTFVAFIRQGCVGEAALIEAADDVLVLAHTPDQVPGRARDAAAKVRAVLGPVEVASPQASAPVEEHGEVDFTGVELTAAESAADDTLEAEVATDSLLDDARPAEVPAEAFTPDDLEPSDEPVPTFRGEDPVAAGVPEPDAFPAGAPASEAESWMDFSAQDEDDGDAEDPQAGDYTGDVHSPEREPASAPPPTARARKANRSADPDARKKLLWVALAVLIVVVLVVLGALG